jgi:hypothetical protein
MPAILIEDRRDKKKIQDPSQNEVESETAGRYQSDDLSSLSSPDVEQLSSQTKPL